MAGVRYKWEGVKYHSVDKFVQSANVAIRKSIESSSCNTHDGDLAWEGFLPYWSSVKEIHQGFGVFSFVTSGDSS